MYFSLCDSNLFSSMSLTAENDVGIIGLYHLGKDHIRWSLWFLPACYLSTLILSPPQFQLVAYFPDFLNIII